MHKGDSVTALALNMPGKPSGRKPKVAVYKMGGKNHSGH